MNKPLTSSCALSCISHTLVFTIHSKFICTSYVVRYDVLCVSWWYVRMVFDYVTVICAHVYILLTLDTHACVTFVYMYIDVDLWLSALNFVAFESQCK